MVWTSWAQSLQLSFPCANISELGALLKCQHKKSSEKLGPKTFWNWLQLDSQSPFASLMHNNGLWWFLFRILFGETLYCAVLTQKIHQFVALLWLNSLSCASRVELKYEVKLLTKQDSSEKNRSENQIRECGRLGSTIGAGWAKLIKNKNKIIQNLKLSLKIGGDKCTLKSHKTCSPTQCSPFCWFNF